MTGVVCSHRPDLEWRLPRGRLARAVDAAGTWVIERLAGWVRPHDGHAVDDERTWGQPEQGWTVLCTGCDRVWPSSSDYRQVCQDAARHSLPGPWLATVIASPAGALATRAARQRWCPRGLARLWCVLATPDHPCTTCSSSQWRHLIWKKWCDRNDVPARATGLDGPSPEGGR